MLGGDLEHFHAVVEAPRHRRHVRRLYGRNAGTELRSRGRRAAHAGLFALGRAGLCFRRLVDVLSCGSATDSDSARGDEPSQEIATTVVRVHSSFTHSVFRLYRR